MEIPEVKAAGKDSKRINVEVAIPNFESIVREKVKIICMKLVESEPLLTKYDTVVGDGDCGLTFERGAKQVLISMENGRLPTNHPVIFFESLADEISSSMGGTSGILLEICFRKMSSYLNSSRISAIDINDIENAFEEGVKAISFYGGANVGSRTMLDALYPAVFAMKSDGNKNPATVAMEGAQSTATMSTASAGRSNYLNEDTLLGTPDPGAIAVAIALSCIYND
jgi:dihydroxyacetone kinase